MIKPRPALFEWGHLLTTLPLGAGSSLKHPRGHRLEMRGEGKSRDGKEVRKQ